MKLELSIEAKNGAYLGNALDYIVSDIGLGLTKGKLNTSHYVGTWSVSQEDEKFFKDHFQFIRVGD